MRTVVYLKPGETPRDSSYSLVICDAKISAPRLVRHSNSITHFVRTALLAGMLPAILDQAAAEGHQAVYVAEPQGELSEVPEVVPEEWLGKWAD